MEVPVLPWAPIPTANAMTYPSQTGDSVSYGRIEVQCPCTPVFPWALDWNGLRERTVGDLHLPFFPDRKTDGAEPCLRSQNELTKLGCGKTPSRVFHPSIHQSPLLPQPGSVPAGYWPRSLTWGWEECLTTTGSWPPCIHMLGHPSGVIFCCCCFSAPQIISRRSFSQKLEINASGWEGLCFW